MARQPNYQFERMERGRAKAAKTAAKAAAKRREGEEPTGTSPSNSSAKEEG